jgi:ADP-ribosyl-[dinitrogen reductase] hydrolase
VTPDRFRGCLLGLAVGDALGAQVEFQPPGTFPSVTDMVGGGPHRLPAGCWTDDTSMALCMAESLLECGGFDPADQMRRYVRWWREGHLSSTGECFDIGETTRRALVRFQRTGEELSGSEDPATAGNGSLMRLAPTAMACVLVPGLAPGAAAESSRTTHAAPQALDACRVFGAILVAALRGETKEALLQRPRLRVGLVPEVAAVADGSYLHREPPEIRATGYVVDTLEAALWAFHHSSSFEDGMLRAVNLGDDADTVGAVYGQLAGAHYGASAIPGRWLRALHGREAIESFADRLHTMATGAPAGR